jgi:hypothetical protein
VAVAQRGSTTTATTANGTSVTANKPTGVVAGDLLLAIFTRNDQGVTAGSGWFTVFEQNNFATTGNHFESGIYWKIATGSEPTTYSFSVPVAAPLAVAVMAFSGVDTSNLIMDGAIAGSGNVTEPLATGSCTNTGVSGLYFYFRATRHSNAATQAGPAFTASGVTEIADHGIYSGGTVTYNQCVYIGSTNFTGGANPPSLNITSAKGSITDNVYGVLTLHAPVVNVAADIASATGTSNDAVGSTGGKPGSISPSATTNSPAPKLTANSTSVAPAATAYQPAVSIKPVLSSITGSSTANSGVGSTKARPDTAIGIVQPFDPEVGAKRRPDADRAFVQAFAYDAQFLPGGAAGIATVTGSAYGAVSGTSGGQAIVGATANDASVKIKFTAETVVAQSQSQTSFVSYQRLMPAGPVDAFAIVYGQAKILVRFPSDTVSTGAQAFDASAYVTSMAGAVSAASAIQTTLANVKANAPDTGALVTTLIGIFSPAPAVVTANAYDASFYLETAAWRTVDIDSESRVKSVPSESRTYTVARRIEDVRVR